MPARRAGAAFVGGAGCRDRASDSFASGATSWARPCGGASGSAPGGVSSSATRRPSRPVRRTGRQRSPWQELAWLSTVLPPPAPPLGCYAVDALDGDASGRRGVALVASLTAAMCDELDAMSWTDPVLLAGVVDDLLRVLHGHACALLGNSAADPAQTFPASLSEKTLGAVRSR